MIRIRNTIGLVKNMFLSKVYGTPYKMNFMVTSACNSRCQTCNIWKDFQSNPEIIEDELSYGEIVKIFERLPKTVSWLSLTGGEPFLRPDFPKVITAAIKHIPQLRLIGIPSNGLLQDRILKTIKMLIRIKHPDIIMTFSIDGPEKVHDDIRGIKGSFKQTWDTYMKARRLVRKDPNFQVAIETTISSKNVRFLQPFLANLLEKNHKVAVTIAHDAHLYKNENDKSFSPAGNTEEVEELVALFNDHLSLLNPQTMIERQYLMRVSGFLRNPSKRVITCEALRSSFALDAKGAMTPCLMWGCKLVNIRQYNYDFKGVWNSKKFRQVRSAIDKNGCPNCWTPCEAYQSLFWAMIKFKIFPR